MLRLCESTNYHTNHLTMIQRVLLALKKIDAEFDDEAYRDREFPEDEEINRPNLGEAKRCF